MLMLTLLSLVNMSLLLTSLLSLKLSLSLMSLSLILSLTSSLSMTLHRVYQLGNTALTSENCDVDDSEVKLCRNE